MYSRDYRSQVMLMLTLLLTWIVSYNLDVILCTLTLARRPCCLPRPRAPGSAGRRGEGVRITSPPTLLLGSLSTDIQETLRTNTERAGVRRRLPLAAPPPTPALLTHHTHCCRSEPQLDARRRGEGGGAAGPRDERLPSTGRQCPGPRPRPGQVGGGQRWAARRWAEGGGRRWEQVGGRTLGRVTWGLQAAGPADSARRTRRRRPPRRAGESMVAAAAATGRWAARPRSSSGGKQSTQTKYT